MSPRDGTEWSPGASPLDEALGQLVPPGIGWAVAPPVGPREPEEPEGRKGRPEGRTAGGAPSPPPLEAEELPFVARAVPSRRAEFAWGRACARAALRRAGASGARLVIPVGPDRAPVWPTGYVGSITHCADLTLAVAGPCRVAASIGVDAEPAESLPEEIRTVVAGAGELRQVALTGLPDRIVFSAKEAIHKALHPVSGSWLDFRDVAVSWRPEGRGRGAFEARAATALAARTPGLERLSGRYALCGPHVLVAVHLPP